MGRKKKADFCPALIRSFRRDDRWVVSAVTKWTLLTVQCNYLFAIPDFAPRKAATKDIFLE